MPAFSSEPDGSLSLPLAGLAPDSFFRRFVDSNQLGRITHFLFQPGMLFNDENFWWGERKKRPRPHEGIDIFLMQDAGGQLKCVAAAMLVPVPLPGRLVHFHRDFLGETIYIQHPEIRRDGAVLHTLYGHLHPGAMHLFPSSITKGQTAGAINSSSATSSVPAHLHVSCAWIGKNQQISLLNWDTMAANDNVIFIDPFPFLLK